MKPPLDVIQVFQTFQTFGGDLDRTAVALNMEREDIEVLSRDGNWGAKIAEWNRLREGQSANFQIQVNRAVNFVQTARIRNILDKVITHLSSMPVEELIEFMASKSKPGPDGIAERTFSSRALTDLVKAAETAHLMTQRALGDTAQERPEESGGKKGSSIALLVQEAMSAAESSGLSSMELVRKELQLPPPPPLKNSR